MANDESNDTKLTKRDQKVTETKQTNLVKNNMSASIILGGLIIALLAGMIGYSMSDNNRFDQRFRAGPMMGERGLSDNDDISRYRSDSMMGRGGGMMRGGYHGFVGIVEAVSESQISLKPMQGGIVTFNLDSNTKVYNNTTEVSLTDLKSGQSVSVQPDQTDSTKAYKITIN